MKRSLTILAFCGVFALAAANATISGAFATKYNVKAGSHLAQAKCGVCHVKATGGALNKYGLDLKAAKVGGKVTTASFDNIASKDSDGDGKKNVEEIRSDSNPGVK